MAFQPGEGYLALWSTFDALPGSVSGNQEAQWPVPEA